MFLLECIYMNKYQNDKNKKINNIKTRELIKSNKTPELIKSNKTPELIKSNKTLELIKSNKNEKENMFINLIL